MCAVTSLLAALQDEDHRRRVTSSSAKWRLEFTKRSLKLRVKRAHKPDRSPSRLRVDIPYLFKSRLAVKRNPSLSSCQ